MVNSTAEIQNLLEALEIPRQQIAQQEKKGYWIIGTGVAVGLLFAILSLLEVALILILAGVVWGIVVISKVNNVKQQYRLDFKQQVIATALSELNSNLKIDPFSGISPTDFVDSYLFSQRPDRYKTEDLVYGLVEKTQIHFAEVFAEYKTQVPTKNGTRTEWHTIFKGIIFCADFNKNFEGVTLVKPKGFSIGLGNWLSKNVFGNERIVELENEAFNKTFLTQSGNQVEARYILTPSLMEKILYLNQFADSAISLSFIHSNVYIAFPLSHNYFEAPIFKSLLDTSVLEKDLNVLRLMYAVVSELDLNTRIWTKQ